MTSYHVIITPISPSGNSNGCQNYNEQMERAKVGKQIMWDDAPGNPTKKGGYLIFLHQLSKKQTNPRVEIHKIMCVKPRSHKLPSWSNRCRNVLFLSERIYTITWNDWENLEVGSSWREMGTRRMADPEKSSKLVKYVEEKIAEMMNAKKMAAAESAAEAARIAKMALNSVSDSGWEPGKKPFWLKYSDHVRKVDSSNFQKEIDQLLSDDNTNDIFGLVDDSDDLFEKLFSG